MIPTEQPLREALLLVDDEESVLFAISEYLSLHGFEPLCARDPDDADRLLESNGFAWVVTDLHLGPALEGAGLAIARRARLLHPGSTIVLLTAHGSGEVVAEAERCGVDQVVAKPVGLADLERILLELRGATS